MQTHTNTDGSNTWNCHSGELQNSTPPPVLPVDSPLSQLRLLLERSLL